MVNRCEKCGRIISKTTKLFSIDVYKIPLCISCQNIERREFGWKADSRFKEWIIKNRSRISN